MASSAQRFRFNSLMTHFSATLAMLLVCLAGWEKIALAQTADRPDRGVGHTGAYSVSDIERINLTNGNVNLSIPLAALPPIAGGKLALALRASYNSKLWDTVRNEARNDPFGPVYVVTSPQGSNVGGWRIGARYDIAVHNAREDYNWLDPAQSDPDYGLLTNYGWWKVVMTTPDGAQHELRPVDSQPFNGVRDHLRGYYSTEPYSGSVARRYYSFDGSYLYAILNPVGSAINWTVYEKDGTRIAQYSDCQRIFDTNGNSIKISSITDLGTGITTVHYQDERTGREIKDVYNPAGGGGSGSDEIQYQTVGGTWVSIQVTWGSTAVLGKVYHTDNPDCPADLALPSYSSFAVIRSITLPQTEPGQSPQQFTFSYNSDATLQATDQVQLNCPGYQYYTRTAAVGWGSLSQIVTPNGALVNYTYSLNGIHYLDYSVGGADAAAREVIATKTVNHDGTNDTWTYNISDGGGSVTGPDGSFSSEVSYSHDRGTGYYIAGPAGVNGLVYYSNQSNKAEVHRHWTLLTFTGAATQSPGGLVSFNPVMDAEYTTLLENGQKIKMSAKTFQYDFNGNLTQETDYDWFDPALVSRDAQGVPTGVPGSAVVLRVVNNTYYNPATTSTSSNVYAKRMLATATPLILNAPRDTIVGASQTRFSYDGQAFDIAPTTKGNLTKVSQWNDQGSQWLDTMYTYDSTYGNRLTTTDPRGNVTTVVYSATTHAQPTQVTVNPNNGTGTQTVTTVYDDATGRVTSQTDPNGQVATTDYTNQRLGAVDPFGRPGIVTGPGVTSVVNGVTYTNQHRKVKMTYYDSVRQVVSESDLNQEGDYKLKGRATSDQLGRPIKTERNEDGTANYTISAQSVYDVQNRVTFTSHPKRSAAAATDGWTRATSDVLGRGIEVATFAGATQPPNTGTNSNWTGSVTSSYNANQTTVTDQIGKMRRSVADGLGRLGQVIEDPNGLNYQTNYTYDTLGNLRRVAQGTQNRYFMYDSLSRLIRARNPEQAVNTNLNLTDPITSNSSWAMKYTYDAGSNLATRVDARNITTTYAYDGLNRNTSVGYNDGVTPTVERYYDSATSGKGRLWYDVTYNVSGVNAIYSRTVVNGYDALGRVTSQSQGFLSAGVWKDYTVQPKYDLASNVTSQTYPSGRTASYLYDAAGRLSQFSGTLGDGGSRTYASNFSYGAGGQMLKEKFQTNATTALYHNLHYNSRSQLVDVRLGTSSTDEWTWNRGALIFYYSNTARSAGNQLLEASDNNGNVTLAQHWVPELDANGNITSWALPQHDVYNYDGLNRLQSVDGYQSTSSTSTTQLFSQKFTYDRYGNRTIDATSWGPINLKQFTVDTATNRLGVPGGQTGTMSYDVAGNLTTDSYTGAGARTYDGENRMITAAGTNGSNTYVYDGNGKRVRRVVGTTETWQVYGIGGELVAEYPANGTATLPQKEYGYRNGQLLLVGGCDVARWLVTDHLGTPRIEVEVGGGLAQVKRHDYLPFGEEMFALGVVRTTVRGYATQPGQDCVRNQFTGHERDNETGLDYFGARYYSAVQGRFTSADLPLVDQNTSNPQSQDLYTYVRNNPCGNVDSNGRCSAPAGLKSGQVGICVEAFIASKRLPGKFFMGRGDNRKPDGNNPDLTSRIHVEMLLSPQTEQNKKGFSVGASSHRAAKSEVSWNVFGVFDAKLQGTSSAGVSNEQAGKDGTTTFTLTGSAKNGFQAADLPGPSGTIDFKLNFVVSPDGKVSLDEGSQTKGYPTYEAYSYRLDSKGNVITEKVFIRPEADIESLEKPMTNVPVPKDKEP